MAAVERDGALYPLADDLSALLGGETAAPAADPVSGAARLAPVVPGKVVAIGLNYLDHIRESGLEPPEQPLVFAKFPSSVVGPGDEIRLPLELTERVDWEVELAVVIGRRASRVAREDALSHVFGYTVANDVSARDLQFADGQWVRGKSLDTFCPLGPVVVTADEISDPQALHLVCRVNGEVVQDADHRSDGVRRRRADQPLLSQLHARARRRPADGHALGLWRVHGPEAVARPGRRRGVRDRRHRYVA